MGTFIWRADDKYTGVNHNVKKFGANAYRELLRMKPSEYFQRQVYACWFFERATVPTAVERIALVRRGRLRPEVSFADASGPSAPRNALAGRRAAKLTTALLIPALSHCFRL